MRRKPLLALVAVALVLWLVVRSLNPRGAGVPASSAGNPASTTTAPPEATVPIESSEIEARAPVPTEPTPPPRSELEPPRTFTLAVLRADDGSEVPFAEVLFHQDDAEFDAIHLRMEEGEGDWAWLETWIAAHGTRATADEHGRVRLECIRPGGTLIARTSELWGARGTQIFDGAEVPLLVERDAEIRVRVVDGAAHPVEGVPVGLVPAGDARAAIRPTRLTDSAGLATLGHVGHLLRRENGTVWLAALRFPANVTVGVELDPDALPSEPIELVLPPTGEVQVEVREPDGELCRAEVRIALQRKPVGPRGFLEAMDSRAVLTTHDGRASFAHVGTGTELQVRAFVDSILTGATAQASGPARAGERVVVPIVVSTAQPRLVGRALGPDGAPLANVPLSGVFVHQRGSGPLRAIETDDAGRFRLPLRQDFLQPLEREFPRAVIVSWRRAGGLAALSARLDLAQAQLDGDNELGDVAFMEPPLLASGIVVDASGASLAGAKLESAQPLEGAWIRHPGPPAISDARGLFELRGWTEQATIRVSALHDAIAVGSAPPLELPVGSVGVRIVLNRCGSVSTAAQLDDGVPRRAIAIFAHGSSDAPAEHLGRDEYRIGRLAPGSYSIVASVDATGEELARADGVEVIGGRETRVPAFDLRGRIHAHELSVLDLSGQPVQSASVSVHSAGADDSKRPLTLARGRLRFFSAQPRVDVVVRASGFAPTLLEGLSEKGELVLNARRSVRITLNGGRYGDTTHKLALFLTPEDSRLASEQVDLRAIFDDSGVAELELAPGRYRGMWVALPPGPGHESVPGWTSPSEIPWRQELEIERGETMQRVSLSAPEVGTIPSVDVDY